MDLKLKDSFQSLQQPLRVFKLSLVKIVLIYWDQVSSIFSWINLLIYVDSSLLTLRERNKNLKKFNKPQVVWLMPIAVSAITLTSWSQYIKTILTKLSLKTRKEVAAGSLVEVNQAVNAITESYIPNRFLNIYISAQKVF